MLAEALTHVPFDCRVFVDLGDRNLPLDELSRLLLAAATSGEVRDGGWRELVIRGPAWRVNAVGMAMPTGRQTALVGRTSNRNAVSVRTLGVVAAPAWQGRVRTQRLEKAWLLRHLARFPVARCHGRREALRSIGHAPTSAATLTR